LAPRARIVLACKLDRSNRDIGRRLHAPAQTLGKWRTRFDKLHLDGLLDKPRRWLERHQWKIIELQGGSLERRHQTARVSLWQHLD
jgi:hypothetical protein